MRMNPWERRQKLLEVLCQRRHETSGTLADEFQVSRETILHDVVILSCSYPVETVRGGHGGISVAEWFRLDRRTLNAGEIALLKRLREHLDGADLEKLDRIIVQFSH